MAEKTHKMTVARATEEEIDQVRDTLSELSMLEEYFAHQYYYEAIKENKGDFPILSKIVSEDRDEFIDSLSKLINNMRYQVVLFNLTTLMENCVNMNSDTLEYNDKISEGLDMVEKYQWISIDNKLPEDDENLIIKREDNLSPDKTQKLLALTDIGSVIDNFRVKMSVGDKEWDWFVGYNGETVTHWMPMPELPKESEVSNG